MKNPAAYLKQLLNVKKRRYMELAKRAEPVAYTLPTGLTFSLYPTGQIAELLYTMNFEFDLLSLVDSFLKPGMNVIDVGANCGVYSVIAGKKIGEEGSIWAFEPAKDSVERLRANLSLNELPPFVVEQIALSDTTDEFLHLVNEANNGDGYRYLTQDTSTRVRLSESEKVPVTTLDAYAKKENIKNVSFLKVDVEGGEFGVFNGAHDVLSTNTNLVILFESAPIGLNRAGHSQDELHQLIRSHNFELYAWDDKQNVWSTNEEELRRIGNVWATRNKNLLPVTKN